MTSRTCPDWPDLMEVAPDLQFKHYTLREAQVPGEVVVAVDVDLDEVVLCCDLETHVFNRAHTDPRVANALATTHWFELREWSAHPPGSAPVTRRA